MVKVRFSRGGLRTTGDPSARRFGGGGPVAICRQVPAGPDTFANAATSGLNSNTLVSPSSVRTETLRPSASTIRGRLQPRFASGWTSPRHILDAGVRGSSQRQQILSRPDLAGRLVLKRVQSRTGLKALQDDERPD